MNIRKISDKVMYVGVNDRVTHKFESMWPLPYGVTYNSYLIADEKIALIDAVEITEVDDLLANIRKNIGSEAKIDYLIVNHMEPDHSGAIPILLDEFPEMKIVGNKLTIGMVKGFYHIDDDNHFLEIKDGEELNLGSKTLRFITTPMVHWPETMMTWLVEDELLFSGDAFGTFGALNGAVVDEDMDTSLYLREAYRYYSNIVGKYGNFVMRAVKKLEGLRYTTLCPTHGPVWRKDIAKISDIYTRLANYESDPGVVIVYGSMYGNTANVAEKIAEGLADRGLKKITLYNAANAELSYMIRDCFRYKGLIIASATYQMNIFPPVRGLLDALESREIKNKTLGLVGSFTWAAGALPEMKKYAERMKLPVVAEISVKQAMSEETQAQINHLCDEVAKTIL
ncbi:MAG: FprA family A-type flavoprotein [Prevotella sp.]|nr:FprA family A-type flavoprotein [Bacteroides sp.]MCM1365796.1 FprA family A-type flavoprotein [Prevotella sp.]MCM1436512.1 FprA family A-type flavoprotein [Prevotella sp.]